MERNPPKMGIQKTSSSQEAAPKGSARSEALIDIGPMEENYQRRALTAMKKHEEENKKKNAPKEKATEEKPKPAETEKMTSENYQKLYLQRKAAEQEKLKQQQQGQQPDKKRQEQETAAKAAVQQRNDDNMRFRAREIRDKIAYWEKQRGNGMYDDNIIDGSINDLQRELGAIPLWLQN